MQTFTLLCTMLGTTGNTKERASALRKITAFGRSKNYIPGKFLKTIQYNGKNSTFNKSYNR